MIDIFEIIFNLLQVFAIHNEKYAISRCNSSSVTTTIVQFHNLREDITVAKVSSFNILDDGLQAWLKFVPVLFVFHLILITSYHAIISEFICKDSLIFNEFI